MALGTQVVLSPCLRRGTLLILQARLGCLCKALVLF